MTEELEQAPEAAPEAEKPKRRTRAKKADEAPVAAAAPASEAAPAAEAAAAEAPAKKPVRKRAPKKTEEAPAPAAEAPVEQSEPAAEAAEPAPAKKPVRRTRKAAEKPVEAATDTQAAAADTQAAAAPEPSAASVEASEAAAPAQDAPAPKPRRRTTRVAAAKAAEGGEETPTATAEALGDKAPAETPAASAELAAAEPAAAEAPSADAAASVETAAESAAEGETSAESAGESSNRVKRDRKKKGKQNQQNQQAQASGEGKGASNQNQGQNQGQGKKNGFDRNDHRRQRRQHGNREVQPSISRDEFAEMKVGDLREKAAEYGIDGSGYRKAELIDVVFEALCKAEGIIEVTGILDIMSDGYGFLRTKGYLPNEGDAYVSLSIIRRNSLRKGDFVVGLTRPAQNNEKYAAIQKVISVNGIPSEELGARVRFADLTPIYPDERLIMEHGKSTTTARVIDLVSPIGKGQRGLIVSPPKAGKTTVLKDIAAAISANNPEVHLMCLLVDERPEEVTDMERSIKGEVISSTFDKPCENHIAVAELVIERAKRLVEQGRDVVILLDSITRLARAYNMGTPASGRILSGGVDSSALYPPKRFLGAARNIENGGSLTILGTALVDTGSKMDEVIFEEFKGTGNMELKLDRSLADKRIFPAIDPITSGTRKEELLLDPQEAPLIWAVRRVLANLNNTERAMDTLVKSIKQTDNNQDFLIRFARKAQTSTKQEGLDL